jgi:hypothetical protein
VAVYRLPELGDVRQAIIGLELATYYYCVTKRDALSV